MRILFTAHHRIREGTGVATATSELAAALRARGHHVDTWAHAEAFGARDPALARLRFPFRVARFLAEAAGDYDVVDAMTGDAWVHLRRRRRSTPTVVSRAHGLEHVASESHLAHLRLAGRSPRWRYRAYTGGYRLWEVRQSLQLADGAVALNSRDAAYMRERLHVPAARVFQSSNGLSDDFIGRPPPSRESSLAGPLAVVFIGSWIPLKGTRVVLATLNGLAARGVPFRATLLGTGDTPPAEILAGLGDAARTSTEVVPAYAPTTLAERLAGGHVLLHPSWTEGFCLALVEAMACGLAPVVTPAGAAYDLVEDGVSGVRVPADPPDCADAIAALARDRDHLHALRTRARQVVQELTWGNIAARTLDFYESRLAAARGGTR